ncbi:conserved oligomeric Golgi complex subunit 1 [Coccinella septempunctata]|uniref:conserved oligomeric Golgi complex subunit 1 n=1 Tax=Coccinella septempunctata TaxID=41139 RepID=UPI001D078EBB|nr:conserved oligomeric Golgi complex subunit 1 [Coccinella septempunctata]
MNKFKQNLTDLDVKKLFVEHKIDEIVEIEKLLDAEIERKRTELRSMVGDRYKDILTASDSIKSMKTISSKIVESIENITSSCDRLLENADCNQKKAAVSQNDEKNNERMLVIQIRLAMYVNDEIWMYLDKEDHFNAAQLYLLGQNIHTGLSLINSPLIQKVPLLTHIKSNLSLLRGIILSRVIKKLESVELTAEQTCSNLNSLMLLNNQSTNELVCVFMEHRKTALETVMNIGHSSVRVQISAILKCLITTIHLLYECFMCDSKNALIFKQLEEILSDNSKPTFSKLKMPESLLLLYIPQIIKEFRPKCKGQREDVNIFPEGKFLEKWLENTKETVQQGLRKSLEVIKNIKGLHLVREEALKIETPKDWEKICETVELPKNFSAWQYFFQSLITERAQQLIADKVRKNLSEFFEDINEVLTDSKKYKLKELDLRSYVWSEDSKDINKMINQHTGISVKAMGFSKPIVTLCDKLDGKFFELLNDLSQYLYGMDIDREGLNIPSFARDQKFVDVDILQRSLIEECVSENMKLSQILSDRLNREISEETVKHSLFCIRILQAITKLCPCFKKCCSLNNELGEWYKICDNFNKCNMQLWNKWIDYSVGKTKDICLKNFTNLLPQSTLGMFLKWDSIEIQEQTDDKVFKSQIKVPLKPSTALEDLLVKLNHNVCCVLPHTLPKTVHVQFIEENVEAILNRYKELLNFELNQNQALQFLFDVKYLTLFCVRRENERLVGFSLDICDKLRSKIDPFDLDVFYAYLQTNVKKAALQSQVIFGCLLPSSMQLSNLEISDRGKEQEKEPSVLAVSYSSTTAWFPLLPITAPSQKHLVTFPEKEEKVQPGKPITKTPKKSTDIGSSVKSNASSLFSGLTTDWFS